MTSTTTTTSAAGPVWIDGFCIEKGKGKGLSNEVKEISYYVEEILSQMAVTGAAEISPIYETRYLADKSKAVHLAIHPDLQKLFQESHRYGPNPKSKEERVDCLFMASDSRKLLDNFISKPNLITDYKGESEVSRIAMVQFFAQNLLGLEKKWEAIAGKWIEAMLAKKTISVCEEVSRLAARYLIEGIFGFNPCTESHIDMHLSFWNKLLAPLPSHLERLKKPESGVKTKSAGFFANTSGNASKLKTVMTDKKALTKLIDEIIAYGLSEEGKSQANLPAFLKNKGFKPDDIHGNVMVIMATAQEKVSMLITFLLYEYAKNPAMQKAHREEVVPLLASGDYNLLCDPNVGLFRVYKEALRYYPTAWALRDAGQDMTVKYRDSQGQEKSHYIRKGDAVYCIPILAGRNPKYWPNVDAFDPNRENLNDVESRTHAFGSGAHACPGRLAAERKMIVTLAKVLSSVELKVEEEMAELIFYTVPKPIRDFTLTLERLS